MQHFAPFGAERAADAAACHTSVSGTASHSRGFRCSTGSSASFRRTGDFFGMFEAHAATLVAAADALTKLVDGGRSLEDHIAEIERGARGRRHHPPGPDQRRRTFLTPFDRGAITSLIGAMDDAIDEMQADGAGDRPLRARRASSPEMKEMVAIDRRGRAAHRRGDAAASRHRRATAPGSTSSPSGWCGWKAHADEIHAAGLKTRVPGTWPDRPAAASSVAREIYKHLERIIDAFEDVANEIDGIVIDHA